LRFDKLSWSGPCGLSRQLSAASLWRIFVFVGNETHISWP